MIAVMEFTNWQGTNRAALFDTNTLDLVESAKIVTEMGKLYEYLTSNKLITQLYREVPRGYENLPYLSRETFS